MAADKTVRTTLLLWLSVAVLWLADPAFAGESAAEQAKVVEAVRQMYVAATDDDLDQFRAVTTPDFYTFDGGKRMSGDQLMALIKDAHAAGKVYVWDVTEPQIHIDGQTAWVT